MAHHILKIKFKQWWSTMPPISTKRPITSRIKSMKRKLWHLALGIQVLDWDSHKNVVGLNWLKGSQQSTSDNRICNGNIYIWVQTIERKKTCTDALPLKKIFFFFPVWNELFYECWNSSAWWVNSRKSPEYVQLKCLYLQLKAVKRSPIV